MRLETDRELERQRVFGLLPCLTLHLFNALKHRSRLLHMLDGCKRNLSTEIFSVFSVVSVVSVVSGDCGGMYLRFICCKNKWKEEKKLC